MSQTLLNPDLEHFIEQELSLGRYPSREALIEQALTLLFNERSPSRVTTPYASLAGTVLHYDDPFEPVPYPEVR
jgi:hypothetical protein